MKQKPKLKLAKNQLRKTLKKLLLIVSLPFVILILAGSAKAQNNQEIINQQDLITRQQQNKIEENLRLKEQENIKKDRERKRKQIEEKNNDQSSASKQSNQCFLIKSINLIDANSLSKRQQKKLISPFIGDCFEAKTLSEIIAAIQNFYNDEGYLTARVEVPKQNIQSGNLELKILEGKIDEVIFKENKLTDKMQKITAFGFIEGDVLNINDINQGLYQINRLQSNDASMKIEPSEKIGEALVYIDNQKNLSQRFPARATISYDNLGNDFSGIRRSNFSGGIDNLLFLNDAISLNYSTNLDDDSNIKDIKSFSSNISIPLGYNTFSFDYSRSEFRSTNAGINQPIRLTGFSQSNKISFDRVLLHKGNLRISSNLSLTTKSSASYLNEVKVDTSERKLTIGNIGFSVSNYFKNGVNLYLKPSYFKGLKILNAKQDSSNLSAATPKAQFDYFKLYGSISKRFQLPKSEIPFTLSSEMDSQYAKQTLFGTEQFSVGGYYSVRGFRENYINGDSGYYFVNKANFNVGSLAAHYAKNLDGITKNLVHLNKFSLEPFYDYGYVKNKNVSDGADGRLTGAGIKTIFSSRYFNASLTYSLALNHSRLITSTFRENKMIYFEISANCC